MKIEYINKFGIEMLIELEGKRNIAYKDVVGFWTIGIGHLLTKSELYSGKIYINNTSLKWRYGLTDEQVYSLFRNDIHDYELNVLYLVNPEINQNQFNALVSFCYNIGINAFANSTLLKKVNAMEYTKVPEQFRRWNKAGGKVIKGLINRREKEIKMWNGEYHAKEEKP